MEPNFKYILIGLILLADLILGGILFAYLSARGRMPIAIALMAMLFFTWVVTAFVVLKFM